MGLIDRTLARLGYEKRSDASDPSWRFLSTATGYYANLSARAAENLSTVLACTNAIATALAYVPALIYRRDGDGNRIEVAAHPLGRLVKGGVNAQLTWPDFMEHLIASALLTGNGMCSLNVTAPVGAPGNMGNAAAKAWNTRFGLYQGSSNVTNAPPDFTGYAYTTTNWPAGANARLDFLSRRGAHAPYGSSVAAGNAETGLAISNAYNPTTTVAQHTQYGADRRLVVAPIIDCASLTGGTHTTTVLGWGCMLMLQPIDNPNDTLKMEYVGLSSATGSPCASSGVAGDSASIGPMVPALVQ